MSIHGIDDAKDIALDALTNLIQLMGAELVAGRHRDDIELFERAVRGRLASLAIEGCPPDVAETGLAIAKRHIERALIQVRAQAKAVRSTGSAKGDPQQECAVPILH